MCTLLQNKIRKKITALLTQTLHNITRNEQQTVGMSTAAAKKLINKQSRLHTPHFLHLTRRVNARTIHSHTSYRTSLQSSPLNNQQS